MAVTQYEYQNDIEPNTISFNPDGDEMLRITAEGFWVRGVKVAQGPGEAQAVYDSFRAFLTWAQMTRPE